MESLIGRCGEYDLIRFIESGGMGEIFLARGPSPDGAQELVVVKRLLPQAARDPVFVGMFMDEAHLTKSLLHPNICRVFQFGRDEDHYYLAMEWVDGTSLLKLLRRVRTQGALPYPLAARIIADVAGALDYAHGLTTMTGASFGIVHRDVSPPNIMVGYSGEVKLLDFGLAKARTQLEKTQPGFVKGKFGYLAPEQIGGRVDARTDIFALGLCLYEALTGEPLFNQSTAADTIAAIGKLKEPPSLMDLRPDMPPQLDEIMRRAMNPDPNRRYRSAGEMRKALEKVLVRNREIVDGRRLGAFVRHMFPERKPEPAPSIERRAPFEPPELDETDLSIELEHRRQRLRLILIGVLAGVVVLIVLFALASSG